MRGSRDQQPLRPVLQACLPTLGRFQGTATLPSHPSGFCCIPVSHSPNKPLRAKERREQARGRGEAGCKPSPASSLLPAPPPWPSQAGLCPSPWSQESSGIRVQSACTMDLLCDLGEDPALSGPQEMMTLEVSTYRVYRLPRQTVSRCRGTVCHGYPQSSLCPLPCLSFPTSEMRRGQVPGRPRG